MRFPRPSFKTVAVIFITAFVVGVAMFFAAPPVTEALQKSEVAYTYNIQGEIVQITGVFNEFSSGNPFKYIVTLNVTDATIVKLSDAGHVLPELGLGYHSVPIPDSDVAGYIDWEASRAFVANPVNSAGVMIYTYKLHDWVAGKQVTLTCHEELGSSGAAELVCAEF